MKLVQIEEQITEARVEEIKKAVAGKEMTKGAAIREMFVGGMETKDIATALGIRYNHAYNVIKNEVLIHGLEVETESRNGSNSKKAQIIASLEAGMSMKDVAAEQKCMYNYVWQVAKAAGLTGKKDEVVAEVATEEPKQGRKGRGKKTTAETVAETVAM